MTYARNIRVRITAEHIAARRQVDPLLAAIREASGCIEVDVDSNATTIGGGLATLVCELPKAARRWMDRFDQGDEVAPFDFDLHLPPWLVEACTR